MSEQVLYNRALAAILTEQGADHYGFADLTSYGEEMEKKYGSTWANYPFAVSFAVNFPTQVVEELLDAPTHTYLYYYDVINEKINQTCLKIANFLEREGFRAFPIPASQRVGDKLSGIFSHRMAARLAGLGWIGKSASLINPQVGPRLRLGTVLTDAPLQGDAPLENRCGACRKCTEICPGHAIEGELWREGEPLSHILDVYACNEHLQEMRLAFGKRICGLCVAVVPMGASLRRRGGAGLIWKGVM